MRELTTQNHSYCSVQEMQRTDGVDMDDGKEPHKLLLTLSEVNERLPATIGPLQESKTSQF
jgi:hypothetical protein